MILQLPAASRAASDRAPRRKPSITQTFLCVPMPFLGALLQLALRRVIGCRSSTAMLRDSDAQRARADMGARK
jgi:hypothetical protein